MMRARAKRRAVLHAAWSATAERVGSLSAWTMRVTTAWARGSLPLGL